MLDAYVSRRITRVIVYMTVTVTLYSRAEVRPSRQQRKSLCYTSLSFGTRPREVLGDARLSFN